MNPKIRRPLKQEKRKIIERLEPFIGGTDPKQEGRPEFSGPSPTYEMSERTRAVPYGGLAAVHQRVRQAGLPKVIDSQLGILKRARPYQDSDHVLNIAYNILCGGQVLDDIEVRRKTPPSWTCWAPARSPTRPRPATSAAAWTKRRSGG